MLFFYNCASTHRTHFLRSLPPCLAQCITNMLLEVEIGVTSDGKTIVCYHPAVDVPYELTQPIERPDPLTNQAETHDQVLKAHLSKEVLDGKKGPTIEELSKMFFTTKHRFYPKGQYVSRRINKTPPKDR
uniref:Large ribosomal subunit protein mL42 n=1 Tax=Xiphophorus couchianus TaxID=32473 RepID=A0A3B5M4Y2_9TELE